MLPVYLIVVTPPSAPLSSFKEGISSVFRCVFSFLYLVLNRRAISDAISDTWDKGSIVIHHDSWYIAQRETLMKLWTIVISVISYAELSLSRGTLCVCLMA